MDFGKAIELEGECTSWIHLFVGNVTKSSLLFDVLKFGGERVPKPSSGVLVDSFVSTGVTK